MGLDERERQDLLVHLAAARTSLDSAIRVLAKPGLEMPAGVERPAAPCRHRRASAGFGGFMTCPDCGATWQEKGAP